MNTETLKETPKSEIDVKNIELRKRVDFQRYLMNDMGVKHGDQKSVDDWIENYAKLVGDIIDNKISCISCADIKSFIEKRDYKEAAKMIIPELKELKRTQAAV